MLAMFQMPNRFYAKSGETHDMLGQAIVLVATPPRGAALNADAVLERCRAELPAYMVPQRIVERASLPRNPNGKIDRKTLAMDLAGVEEAIP